MVNAQLTVTHINNKTRCPIFMFPFEPPENEFYDLLVHLCLSMIDAEHQFVMCCLWLTKFRTAKVVLWCVARGSQGLGQRTIICDVLPVAHEVEDSESQNNAHLLQTSG